MKKKKKRVKKGEQFSLSGEYRKSFDYIGNSKNFIYFIVILFFAFSLIGFFVPASDMMIERILDFIEQLMEQTSGFSSPSEWINFIFKIMWKVLF